MNKKRIYIAGQITGLTLSAAKHNFNTAKYEVSLAGFSPLSPMDLPHDHDHSWKSYMREDLAALKTCQGVYMLRNWSDSRGARLEEWFARRYGKTLYYQPASDGSPGGAHTVSFSLLTDINLTSHAENA